MQYQNYRQAAESARVLVGFSCSCSMSFSRYGSDIGFGIGKDGE